MDELIYRYRLPSTVDHRVNYMYKCRYIPNTDSNQLSVLAPQLTQVSIQTGAGSSTCATKPLSQLLATIPTAILRRTYCDTACSRMRIGVIWTLKTSEELRENLKYPAFICYNIHKNVLLFY